MRTGPDGEGARDQLARNRQRQRELYGLPLGDRVHRLTRTLGITQARLACTLGVSPAMLSQLASARRVKIGDPAVLARLHLLDRRCGASTPHGRPAVEALLDEVARAQLQWSGRDAPGARAGIPEDALRANAPGHALRAGTPGNALRAGTPADALRAVAPPARLAAAAVALGPAFPELAQVLREAAARPPAHPPARPRVG
jgi:transcriptional regulator with XRE-family HTH domain